MNLLIQNLIIIISLLGFPIGLIIAKFTKEELQAGKKWFLLIIIVCIMAIIISIIFIEGETLFFLISIFIFILLLSLASLISSRK